jgi:hypothetical protein
MHVLQSLIKTKKFGTNIHCLAEVIIARLKKLTSYKNYLGLAGEDEIIGASGLELEESSRRAARLVRAEVVLFLQMNRI